MADQPRRDIVEAEGRHGAAEVGARRHQRLPQPAERHHAGGQSGTRTPSVGRPAGEQQGGGPEKPWGYGTTSVSAPGSRRRSAARRRGDGASASSSRSSRGKITCSGLPSSRPLAATRASITLRYHDAAQAVDRICGKAR